jgi:hypothetical protein
MVVVIVLVNWNQNLRISIGQEALKKDLENFGFGVKRTSLPKVSSK